MIGNRVLASCGRYLICENSPLSFKARFKELHTVDVFIYVYFLYDTKLYIIEKYLFSINLYAFYAQKYIGYRVFHSWCRMEKDYSRFASITYLVC